MSQGGIGSDYRDCPKKRHVAFGEHEGAADEHESWIVEDPVVEAPARSDAKYLKARKFPYS